MSLIETTIDESTVAQPAAKSSTGSTTRWGRGFLAWTIFGCVLLGTSGVIRTIQERRHKDEMNFVEACPFPLKDIPTRLGVWKMKEGGDRPLDDRTMLITGGTDHIFRIYFDELTGVTLTVLILFGPAEPVMPHTPEVCYPANGFSNAQNPMNRNIPYTIKGPNGQNVTQEVVFRSSVYEKTGGLSVRREEAFHSFRLEGQWSPDVGMGRKFPRRNPSVFKIQIQRMVAAGENRDLENPIDQFVSLLVAEIEREIEAGQSKKRVATK